MFLGLRAGYPVLVDFIPIFSELSVAFDVFELMDTPDFIDSTSRSIFGSSLLASFSRNSRASLAILFSSRSLVRSALVYP